MYEAYITTIKNLRKHSNADKLQEKIVKIQGYNNYLISNFGYVISTKGHKKILKSRKDKDGYLVLELSKNNKQKTFKIHRLVALHFLEKPIDKKYNQVNHKDENKQNNRVDNLEWTTSKLNNNYGTRNERLRQSKTHKIVQMDLNENILKIWNSAKELSKHGFDLSNIYRCCEGKRKTHKGYKFRRIY